MIESLGVFVQTELPSYNNYVANSAASVSVSLLPDPSYELNLSSVYIHELYGDSVTGTFYGNETVVFNPRPPPYFYLYDYVAFDGAVGVSIGGSADVNLAEEIGLVSYTLEAGIGYLSTTLNGASVSIGMVGLPIAAWDISVQSYLFQTCEPSVTVSIYASGASQPASGQLLLPCDT
jgi:hypothetical protein